MQRRTEGAALTLECVDNVERSHRLAAVKGMEQLVSRDRYRVSCMWVHRACSVKTIASRSTFSRKDLSTPRTSSYICAGRDQSSLHSARGRFD